MMDKNFIYIIFTSILLLSCKAKVVNDVDYLQNDEKKATEQALITQQSTIQTGDILVILISAKDQDVVKPFNQNYASSQLVQPSIPGGNMPNNGVSSFTGPTYIVDTQGNIDFPVLGLLSTTGKTMVQFKNEVRDKVSQYVKEPTVNLRISNFQVTVLGEVNRQGEYNIPNGQGTIFTALGLAGDTTIYGERTNVLVVRTVDGILTKNRINLLDDNFISSPFYNLKQGDVIYVSANKTKQKTAKLDPYMPIYVSVAGIIVTILALVFKK
jgi:polysaccharide export outer membrane protein